MSIGFVQELREQLGCHQKAYVNAINFTWLRVQAKYPQEPFV